MGSTPSTKANNKPLIAGIVCFFAIGALLAFVSFSDKEALEARVRQEEARKAQQRTEAAASHALQKAFCETVNVCKKYGTVRQDCAVAGNFKNCVQVKMNLSYATLETDCNDDGTLRWQPANVPTNAVTCFFALNLP